MTTTADRASGFTLIEMLVTLLLLAILSAMTWQALDATERTRARTVKQHHDTLALLRLLDQFEQDISQHALLDSPYPNPAGQITSPDTSVLPRALQWHDNQLTIMRLSADGQRQPIVWRVHAQRLVRQPLSRHPGTLHTDEMQFHPIDGWGLRVWVPQRGWFNLHDVPAGLRASGLELRLDVSHQGQRQSYRKVVMLP